MVDIYSRESAPQQKLRSIVAPIAQRLGQTHPGDLESQPVVSKLWDTDETKGAPRAFLSRFVVLQAIGAAAIVGLWLVGIADKPFAGDNAFLCWLIAAIGALGVLCVFFRRWRDVDWLATHVVRIGLLGTVVGLIVAFSAAPPAARPTRCDPAYDRVGYRRHVCRALCDVARHHHEPVGEDQSSTAG